MNWINIDAARPKDPMSKLGLAPKPPAPKLGKEVVDLLRYLLEAILSKEREFVEARNQYIDKINFRKMTPDQLTRFRELAEKKGAVDKTISEIRPWTSAIERFLRTTEGLAPEQYSGQKMPLEVKDARNNLHPLVDALATQVDEFVSAANAFVTGFTTTSACIYAADNLGMFRKLRKPVGEASRIVRKDQRLPEDKKTLDLLSAQSRMFHWALRILDEFKRASLTIREEIERSPRTTEIRWELAQLQDRIDREIPRHYLDEVEDIEETLREAVRIDENLKQPLSPETSQLVQEYMAWTEKAIAVARDADKLLKSPVSKTKKAPGGSDEPIPEGWEDRVDPKPGQIGLGEAQDIQRELEQKRSSVHLAYAAAQILCRLEAS